MLDDVRLNSGAPNGLRYAFCEASFRELGLGWDVADAELYSAEADFFPVAGARVGPRLAVLRCGEGDFRQPFPASFDSLPQVLTGIVEATVRFAVAGATLDCRLTARRHPRGVPKRLTGITLAWPRSL